MSNDPANEMQTAIYTALQAETALTSLVSTRIYDNVPQETVYPYVELGEATYQDMGSQTFLGMDGTLTIHSWSQYAGRKQVMQIMEAIYDRLHQGSLTMTGHSLVICRFEFAEIVKDPDGITHHGVQRFRVITRRN